MKLLLSSDAAPAASIEDLTRACRRRALTGLELTLGAEHNHGLDRLLCPSREQAGVPCLPQERASVEWFRLPPTASVAMHMVWASGAHRLGAGLLLTEPLKTPPLAVRSALVHGTNPAEAEEAAQWAQRHSAHTCWEVTPESHEPDVLEAVLAATGERLAHVRFLGAGPEAQASDAADVHPLWSMLALQGYTGTVALAPSPGANLQIWHRWLFEGRGWGCGAAAEKKAARAS